MYLSLQLISNRALDRARHIRGTMQPKIHAVRARRDDGAERLFSVITRIETPAEGAYDQHGGVLPYVLR